jgi:hypothetical protein
MKNEKRRQEHQTALEIKERGETKKIKEQPSELKMMETKERYGLVARNEKRLKPSKNERKKIIKPMNVVWTGNKDERRQDTCPSSPGACWKVRPCSYRCLDSHLL